MRRGVEILPERIECEGLVLRRWLVSDAELMERAVADSAEHLRPWMAWMAHEPLTLEHRRRWLRRWLAQREREFSQGGDVVLGIFKHDQVAGSCGLHRRRGPAASRSATGSMSHSRDRGSRPPSRDCWRTPHSRCAASVTSRSTTTGQTSPARACHASSGLPSPARGRMGSPRQPRWASTAHGGWAEIAGGLSERPEPEPTDALPGQSRLRAPCADPDEDRRLAPASHP